MNHPTPTLGVLIRFANSAATLPGVLAALRRQTRQPDVIIGIASHSTDGSRSLMQSAGATVHEWHEAYDHSRVLNFGMRYLQTDLVLVLSSHTVLESADALEQMIACFADHRVACVSAKWDDDPFYSSAISWGELQAKGLRFGSIYSNSMGMIRRTAWLESPFDEEVKTAEDYAWALEQLRRGHLCRRLTIPFSYQRNGYVRDAEFAGITFTLAKKHGLRVTWLGVRGTLRLLAKSALGSRHRSDLRPALQRLAAWFGWQLAAIKSPLSCANGSA